MLLALDEQRVEHRAAVVDGDVAQQSDLAGVGVDLDHGDVGTERERRVALVEVELGQPRCLARPSSSARSAQQLAPVERLGRHTGDADRAGRGVDDDVGDIGLEQPGSELAWPCRPAPRWRRWTADPPSCSERDPPVPPPVRTRSVSPSTSVMRSTGMPVWSVTIMANAVWWP